MWFVSLVAIIATAIVIGVTYDADSTCRPTITTLGTYPEYTGPAITGDVSMAFDGTSVTVAYNLAGVEAECSTASDAGNSCGIHIHAGTSCATTSDPLGHYYYSDSSTVTADPWSSITYSSGMDGTSTTSRGSTAKITTGYTADQTFGRVFVVHNRAGDRVTCAVIQNTCQGT